jgi:Protein of unknown function (DUF3738)
MAAATEAAPSFEAADVHASPYRRFGDGSGANSSGTSAAPDPNGAITLFDAVSKQLGLKLEKQRRPVQVLLLDQTEEKPTENCLQFLSQNGL